MDVIRRAIIEHQANDGLVQISKADKENSPTEDELPLLAIYHVVNADNSENSDNGNNHHVVNINITDESKDKPTYDQQTLVK